jgi:hypothetical protein
VSLFDEAYEAMWKRSDAELRAPAALSVAGRAGGVGRLSWGRAASTTGRTRGGSHAAPAAAKWPGSRIPTRTFLSIERER